MYEGVPGVGGPYANIWLVLQKYVSKKSQNPGVGGSPVEIFTIFQKYPEFDIRVQTESTSHPPYDDYIVSRPE